MHEHQWRKNQSDVGANTKPSQIDYRVATALRMIEENYNERLTVRQLAQHLGLSDSRFKHLFAERTGSTFKIQLRKVRLENAKHLLNDCALSVKEVCFKVGYSYLPNFCRDFKKRFGETPSQFKRQSIASALLNEPQDRNPRIIQEGRDKRIANRS